LNFFDRITNNNQKSNYTKIRSVGTELFHADGRTDGDRQTDRQTYRHTDRQTGITKVIVAFRKFFTADMLHGRNIH